MPLDWDEMNRRLMDLDEAPNFRIWRVDYESLSKPEKVYFAVRNLEDEVSNGGFWQFFINTSGRSAPDLAAALETIGAASTARIAREAIAAVGAGVNWGDDADRQARIEELPQSALDKLDQLDEDFFEFPDDLTGLLYQYVADHRQEMGAPVTF